MGGEPAGRGVGPWASRSDRSDRIGHGRGSAGGDPGRIHGRDCRLRLARHEVRRGRRHGGGRGLLMPAIARCPNASCRQVSQLVNDPLGRIFRCPRCLTKLPTAPAAAADSGWTAIVRPTLRGRVRAADVEARPATGRSAARRGSRAARRVPMPGGAGSGWPWRTGTRGTSTASRTSAAAGSWSAGSASRAGAARGRVGSGLRAGRERRGVRRADVARPGAGPRRGARRRVAGSASARLSGSRASASALGAERRGWGRRLGRGRASSGGSGSWACWARGSTPRSTAPRMRCSIATWR